MMGVKVGILLVTLLVGSFAIPTPNEDEWLNSEWFYHTNPSARIVGGLVAPEGGVPYMVAMSQGVAIRSFMCGGSILSQRTVLTAAHCIPFSFGSLSSSLRVTVGTNRWNTGGQTLSVTRNVTHPNYVSSRIKNDLGLLILASNIQWNNRVAAVALDNGFVGNGVSAVVAGWGRVVHQGSLSAVLLQLTLSTIDGARCVREVPLAAAAANMIAPAVEPHIELCTIHSPGHGTCNGDSGSALVRASNRQQIGIVSWGIPCARGGPDMFVRVSAFTNWIRSNTV